MVGRKIILNLLSLAFLPWMSCKDKCKVDEFSFKREDYTGSDFRLDGYYWWYDLDSQGDTSYSYKIFYRNGVCINSSASDLNKLEQSFADGSYLKLFVDDRYSWGVYSVIEDSILKIEYWFPRYTCGANVSGSFWRIKKDSSIVLLRSNENIFVKELQELKFKHFSPKPDSTNNFIH